MVFQSQRRNAVPRTLLHLRMCGQTVWSSVLPFSAVDWSDEGNQLYQLRMLRTKPVAPTGNLRTSSLSAPSSAAGVATLALFGTRVRLGAMRAAVFLTLQFHSLSWWNTAMTAGMGTGFGFHIYSPSVRTVSLWLAS
jgi:hypothetical protein